MALSATIYKANLNVADTDRGYFGEHTLTLALHPSENELRMMLRLLCFALFADERLSFTKGLSTEDEPDLWQKSLSDECELWIEFGQPDEKRLRKACGRAKQVVIVNYQPRAALVWWQQMQGKLSRFQNLSVLSLEYDEAALLALCQRSMQISALVQDAEVMLSDGNVSATVRATYR
jgi:uncharacterized protein YaeQ